MGKSLRMFAFLCCIVFFFVTPLMLSAEPSPCIGVLLEATPVVKPLDKALIQGLGHVKLSLFVDSGSCIKINLPKNKSIFDAEVLIIERDGTKLKEAASFLKQEDLQEVELLVYIDGFATNLSRWIFHDIKISETGIYRISYSHPWKNKTETVLFKSNTLLFAVVTSERFKELQDMLSGNSNLDRASYEFRNPPFGPEYPKYFRAKPLTEIEKVLKIGDERDKVLFLLGSPDSFSLQQGTDWDEYWSYELSPCGGYDIAFRKGKIVRLGRAFDSPF